MKITNVVDAVSVVHLRDKRSGRARPLGAPKPCDHGRPGGPSLPWNPVDLARQPGGLARGEQQFVRSK